MAGIELRELRLPRLVSLQGAKKSDANYKIEHLDTEQEHEVVEKVLEEAVPCGVILAGSVAHHALQLAEYLVLVLNATATPLLIAFGVGPEMLWTSTGTDLVYLLLMVCKLRTSFYNEQGDLCCEWRAMAGRYLRRYVLFTLDLASVVPSEHFTDFDLSVLRLGNLARSYDFSRLAGCSWLFAALGGLRSRLKKFLGFVVYFHLLICLWVYVNRLEGADPMSWRNREVAPDTPAEEYLEAAYFVLVTATSVGYGDMVPGTPMEYLVTILLMHLGVIAYSLICGSIINVIRDANSAIIRKRERKNFLRHLADTLEMDEPKARILGDLSQTHPARSSREKHFLGKLPITMRTELSYYLHARWVADVPYLRRLPAADRHFAGELCLALKAEVLEAGEYLFGRQERPEVMYFYKQGTIELVFPDGTTAQTSEEVYGDIDVILFPKRCYQFRATSPVELLKLDRKDYDRIFNYLFPKKGEEFTQAAIAKNKRIIAHAKADTDHSPAPPTRSQHPSPGLIQVSKDLQKVESNLYAFIKQVSRQS